MIQLLSVIEIRLKYVTQIIKFIIITIEFLQQRYFCSSTILPAIFESKLVQLSDKRRSTNTNTENISTLLIIELSNVHSLNILP